MRIPLARLALALSCLTVSLAHAGDISLTVELGPVTGVSNENRVISFDEGSRQKRTLYDAQDGHTHFVRGISLADLLAKLSLPKHADTVVLQFANGMQVPVHLSDKDLIQNLFIAFEHKTPLDSFGTSYPLAGLSDIRCPKIVYSRPNDTTALWRYTTQLTSLRLVTWDALQAILAQPTRHPPTMAGWKLYSRHCQPCHGMGGAGATRGPDFISDLDAYRRIPPLSVSEPGELPSLHDKLTGRVPGDMPTLHDVSNTEIKELWSFLHSVKKGSTK